MTLHRLTESRLARGVVGVALSWVLLTGVPFSAGPRNPSVHQAHVDLTDGSGTVVAGAPVRALAGPAPSRAARFAAGWRTRVTLPEKGQMVALRWTGSSDGALRLRSHDAQGWSKWVDVAADDDEAPDAGTEGVRTDAHTVGPIWVGDGTDAVDVHVQRGTLRNVRLDVLRVSRPAPSPFAPESASADLATPGGIVPRSAWAGDGNGWAYQNDDCGAGPRYATRLEFGVLHHTVNTNDYSPDGALSLILGIYRYHTQAQDHLWCDIAYNFIVDRFGRVIEGRMGGIDQPVIGGHAKDYSTGSVGVAMLGDYSRASVTGPEREAVRRLFAWKFSLSGLDAQGTFWRYGSAHPVLAAHRDLNQTDCPGGYAYPLMAGLRRDVQADVLAAAPSPISRWAPAPWGQGFLTLDAYGGVHPGGAQTPVAQNGYWSGAMVARDLVPAGAGLPGGYVVDAFGGLHPYGGAPGVMPSAVWPGWDIVRGAAAGTVPGSGYVLDGFGGLHAYGNAVPVVDTAYWPGWDIARAVATDRTGTSGYTLDAYGGLHPFGAAPARAGSAYWYGWDIARDVALRPDGTSGYVLDGWGGIHPFGGAPDLGVSAYGSWVDAKAMALSSSGTGGWVLAADGRVFPFGDQRTDIDPLPTTWIGRPLARGIIITAEG
jgi:hypothetical protein